MSASAQPLRDYPADERQRRWQQQFVGRSGIRLRVRLSIILQPANWVAEAPPFASCLDESSEADALRAAARSGWPSRGASSPTRAPDAGAHALSASAGAGSGRCGGHADAEGAHRSVHEPAAPPPWRMTRRSLSAAAAAASSTPVRAGGKRLRDAPMAAGALGAGAGADARATVRAGSAGGAPSSSSRALDDIESLHKAALSMELDGASRAES
jgi:hypothetical protein